MPRVPASYRAYVYERFGAVEQILQLKQIPTAPLAASQLRIQVRSAALNPVDYKIPELYQEGFTKRSPSIEAPLRIGFDVSGVVAEVGKDAVGKFRVGDAVYAMPGFSEAGSLAEFLSVDSALVAHKPKTLDFDHAAGVPLACETSYQGLVAHAKLQPGERILILGGSTATGIFAIQLAKALGAYVTATTSAKNVAFVKSLGADQVIDYTSQQWGRVVKQHSLDVLLDCAVEPQSWEDNAQLVLKKNTGRFVTFKRGLEPSAAKFGAAYHEVFLSPSGKDLAKVSALIDAGKAKVFIDSIFPLEKITEAFARLKTGRAVGKVIVKVSDHDSSL